MDFNEYQKKVAEERHYWRKTPIDNITICALGVSGEAGEVADMIKKIVRGDSSLDDKKEDLKKELGDVLWYLSQLAQDLGIDFNDVAQANIEKLDSRKKRGKLRGDGNNR